MNAVELDEIRSHFPALQEWIFCNNAADSPLPDFGRAAIDAYLDDCVDCPCLSFPDHLERLERCRERIGRLVGVPADGVALVKNTSQGIWIAVQSLPLEAGDEVLLNDLEFPANIFPWEVEARRRGWTVRRMPVPKGVFTVDDVAAALTDKTKVLALSWVQYANGFRADLPALGALCKERGIYFVVDAIQGAGALEVDLTAAGVHFAASGGHKWLLGICGAGFLTCAPGLLDRMRPANYGWVSATDPMAMRQELELAPSARRFEEGTTSFAGIFVLDATVGWLLELGPRRIEEHVLALSKRVTDGARSKGYEVLSPQGPGQRSGISLIASKTFPVGELFETLLTKRFVTAIRGPGLRISPHVYNTHEEMDALVEALPEH